jgi:hypothetical protein
MVKPLLDVEPALGAFVGYIAGFSWATTTNCADRGSHQLAILPAINRISGAQQPAP